MSVQNSFIPARRIHWGPSPEHSSTSGGPPQPKCTSFWLVLFGAGPPQASPLSLSIPEEAMLSWLFGRAARAGKAVPSPQPEAPGPFARARNQV